MLRTAGWGLGMAAGLFFSCLFVALNYASLLTNRDAILEAARHAFSTGDLVDDSYLPPSLDVRGVHQFNDCLIISLVIDDRATIAERVVSPFWAAAAEDGGLKPCLTLRTYLQSGSWSAPGGFYHQYLHGHRVLAAFLLHSFPVWQARIVLLTLNVAALAGILAWGLLGLLLPASGDRTCSYERIIKRVSLSICSAGFLLFYAIPYFGMSLAHGPSDLVLGSFLVVLAALPTQNLSDRGWYLLACCFGAFVAYFEFLTGGLPLGCALLIASAAVCPRASDNTGALWRRAVAMVFYFLSTAAFCFAFKVALVSLTIEQSAFLHFLRDLTRKMSGEVGGWLYELEVLVQFSGMMLFGWRFSAEALLAVSLLTIGSWMYYAIVHVRDRVLQTRQSLLLASVGVIALWFGLFREHTIVHAFFMVRLLAWIPIVGATMFGLTLIHVRARATIGA